MPQLVLRLLLHVPALALLTVGLTLPLHAQTTLPEPSFLLRKDPRFVFNAWPADFNRDSRVDLIAGTADTPHAGVPTNLIVARGRGDGTFDAPRSLGVTAKPLGVGDFNNDSRVDALAFGDGALFILPGNGNLTFAARRTVASGPYFDFAHVFDFNGDGRRDILVATLSSLVIYPGNGDFTFRPPVELPVSEINSPITGDFNRDGRRDVINFECSTMTVFLNRGGLLFDPQTSHPDTGSCVTDSTAWDINGDSRLDLIVSASSREQMPVAGNVAVMLGNGNGTFQPSRIFDTGVSGEQTVVAGDFNRDGKADVATGNWSNFYESELGFQLWDSVSILPGDGTGRLGRATTYSLDYSNFSSYMNTHNSLNTADLNGDRHTDLIASPSAILLNRVPVANRTPTVWAGFDDIADSAAAFILKGQASDRDNHWLTFTWRNAAGEVIGNTPRLFVTTATTGPGRHRFTLTVDDGHGGSATDGVFINVPDLDNFITLGIDQPRFGAILTRGAPYEITFGGTEGAFRRFDLWVSSNDGRSWSRIAACTNLPGTARRCTWPSAGPVSETARLRVVGFDTSGVTWVGVGAPFRIR
jgi:hypothetical protein